MGRGGLLLGEAMVLLVEVTMEEAAKQAVVQRVGAATGEVTMEEAAMVEVTMEEAAKQAVVQRVGVEAWVKEVVASVEA